MKQVFITYQAALLTGSVMASNGSESDEEMPRNISSTPFSRELSDYNPDNLRAAVHDIFLEAKNITMDIGESHTIGQNIRILQLYEREQPGNFYDHEGGRSTPRFNVFLNALLMQLDGAKDIKKDILSRENDLQDELQSVQNKVSRIKTARSKIPCEQWEKILERKKILTQHLEKERKKSISQLKGESEEYQNFIATKKNEMDEAAQRLMDILKFMNQRAAHRRGSDSGTGRRRADSDAGPRRSNSHAGRRRSNSGAVRRRSDSGAGRRRSNSDADRHSKRRRRTDSDPGTIRKSQRTSSNSFTHNPLSRIGVPVVHVNEPRTANRSSGSGPEKSSQTKPDKIKRKRRGSRQQAVQADQTDTFTLPTALFDECPNDNDDSFSEM